METNFAIADQQIELSSDPLTYNETYFSPGPFAGYRPYAGVKDAPELIWMEGTLEARIALTSLGRDTSALDKSINAWREVAGTKVAPLMANRTQTDRFNEYHVWPVSAAASWTLLGHTAKG